MAQIASIQDFQREVVTRWAAETITLLQGQIVRKGLVATEDLLRSLSYEIVREAAGGVGINLSFNTYGRILDMNRQKIKPQELNRRVLLGGKEAKAGKGASNRKWYSKTIFNSIYGDHGLVDRLLNGYGQWALERIQAALA